MPDNSFEKKVRDKLNEFGLSPTTRVWEGVEAKLHEKRKRERGILWFVLALLLLGGGGYFLYSGNNSADQQTLSALDQKKDSAKDGTSNANKTDTQTSSEEKNETASVIPSVAEKPQSQSAIPTKEVSRSNSGSVAKASGRNITPAKKTNDISTDSEKSGAINQQKSISVLKDPELNQVSNEKLTQKIDEKDQAKLDNPSETLTTEGKPLPVSADSQKKSAGEQQKETEKATTKKKLAKEKQKGWQFGISANIGLTALPQYFLAGPQKSMRADNLNIGSLPGVPPMAPPMYYPYSQEQEYGWGAGLWSRRDISKKMALSGGLQYQYYSTSTKTGYQATGQVMVNNGYSNVSLDNYYLPGSVTEYRNRYHLIQLPLQIRTTFGKKNLVPVSLSAGIQPGWLAGSNALLKDSSGILYSDKANFNHFQFGLNAGFHVRLLNKSRMPLDIGPVLQYQLTSAFRENTGYSGHLLFVGLQADWQLFNLNKKQRQ